MKKIYIKAIALILIIEIGFSGLGTNIVSATSTNNKKVNNTYTASKVKDKLKGIGYKESNGSYIYEINKIKYATYKIGSGNTDMSIQIHKNNKEFNSILLKTLKVILPSSGDKLHKTITQNGLKAQTINYEGRSIQVIVKASNITLEFSPIKATVNKPGSGNKIYTGEEVKKKLYGLGFFDRNGATIWTESGKYESFSSLYMSYYKLEGQYDMRIAIFKSDVNFDKKLKIIFGYILPQSGNKLYSILDNPKTKSQTIKLDNRKVYIEVSNTSIMVEFGPIIK